jgi:hypothetical protein
VSPLTIDTGAEGIGSSRGTVRQYKPAVGCSTPAVPRVGMLTECHGQTCRIVAVHYPGTLDVESPSGKCFRISGLWFPKEGGSL